MGGQCVLSIVGYRCFKKSLICDTVAGCNRDCISHFLLQLLFLWDPTRGYKEQGDNVIYFRGTGEHMSKNERNRGTKVIFGSREHWKIRFWFWGTRENAEIFQGNKGTGTPHLTPWEGLSYSSYYFKWAGAQHFLEERLCAERSQLSLRILTILSVFAGYSVGSQGSKASSSGQRRLISLRICAGWSESTLCAQAISKEMLCPGSNFLLYCLCSGLCSQMTDENNLFSKMRATHQQCAVIARYLRHE